MASEIGAERRIRYLIGDGPYQGSPSTISGNDTAIYSYRLNIAWRDSTADPWQFIPYDECVMPSGDVSRTTRRHLRAAWYALGGTPDWMKESAT